MTNASGNFNDLLPGDYIVTITDANGCTLSVNIEIGFTGNTIELEKIGRLISYPNPTTDKVFLSYNSNIKATDIHIFNTQSQLVTNYRFSNDEQSLNLEALASGVYFIHIKNTSLDIVLKQIKI